MLSSSILIRAGGNSKRVRLIARRLSSPLEAVKVLREFLEAHPKHHYAQLRIAEIYHESMRNRLAAALEYEDLLTKKLDPERWGWTAIRLVRLYSQLGKRDKAVDLLRRVANDYGKTSAAHKAEKLLGEVVNSTA